MQQPNQDQQDDANGDGSRPSSPFPDQLQNRNYGRRIVRTSSAVGAASASSSAMAFPTRRRVHAAGAGAAAAASPASAGGTSRGDARAIIESSDPRQEDVNTDNKISDSVDAEVQDVSGTATNSNSSSHEEGSRRSSLEIAMEAAAAPKILLQAEQQDQKRQEYHQQDHRRPSHYIIDDPYTSHDYLVPLKGGGSDHGPDPTTIEDDDEAHPAPSPRSTSKRTLALHQQPRRSMRVPQPNSRPASHRPAAAQRSNSFVSLDSSIGSIGSYIEDRLGDMMDGSISILNRENSATAAARRGGRKNMLRTGEVSQDETGGLLDSSDGNIIDGHHHPHNNSSSQSLDLHSIDEVVVVDADDDPNRRSKKRSSMHSETSMLTDDDLEDHLHNSGRRKRVHAVHRSSSGGADIHDRIDRLERMLQEQRQGSGTGDVGDGAAGHRSFRSFLSADLGFGSVEKRSQGHHCRWYVLMAVGVATVLGLTFRLGMYEGSRSTSGISNAGSNGWRPSQSIDDEDDLSRFIPKVSLALENALDAAKAKTKKDESQGKNSDLIFSETNHEVEDEEPENDDSDDKRSLELMVQCTNPSGCLEAIKLADVVKIDESIRSNMVSIALSPDKFDDLRAIPNIRTIDLDYKIEGVEDEIVEAHIDLAEMEARQNSSITNVDGNLRGRRRTVQSIPPGFEMIQAVKPDGTPFRAGPHERRICIADTGTCKGHPDLYRGFPSQFDGQDLHMFGGSQSFEWDVDKHSHGCHMHGILQATHNNIISNVFITRALNERKEGSISQMMAAIDQCVDAGAHIILLSLGCFNCEQAMNENFFRKIHRKGIVMIAAAGNNGHLDDAPPMIPAAFPTSTISVGAVNLQKKRHYMSAVNSQVEFCANGVDIISTGFELVGGRYYWDYVKKTGSSMAAPQVAAVVSLLWSHFPNCSGDQIRSVLAKTTTGHKYSYGPCDESCGFGIPQLQDAYDLLDSTRSYPGSDDYDCNVAGLILSSTNNVCDCINSRGDLSKCLDVSSISSGAAKVSQYQQPSSHSSTNTRCADDSSARFKLAVSSRNLQIQVLNRQKNRNNNKKRNRRKVTRGCEFVGKASYMQIVKYCRNTKVRQSCKRTCSYAGFEYTDCTF